MVEQKSFNAANWGELPYGDMRLQMHAFSEGVIAMYEVSNDTNKPKVEISDNETRIIVTITYPHSKFHLMYHTDRQKCLALFEGTEIKDGKKQYVVTTFPDVHNVQILPAENAIICKDDMQGIKIFPDGTRTKSLEEPRYDPSFMYAMMQYAHNRRVLEAHSQPKDPIETDHQEAPSDFEMRFAQSAFENLDNSPKRVMRRRKGTNIWVDASEINEPAKSLDIVEKIVSEPTPINDSTQQGWHKPSTTHPILSMEERDVKIDQAINEQISLHRDAWLGNVPQHAPVWKKIRLKRNRTFAELERDKKRLADFRRNLYLPFTSLEI